ncbi:MAG: TonB-dependent receptor domain-containing protein, partial [Flavitalea sp.]
MRSFIFTLLCFICFTTIQAQMPAAGGRMGGTQMTGRFYGKVMDAKAGKPIEAASVQLIQSKFDTVTRKRKDTILTGMLTSKNGEFSLENLPLFGNYKLSITGIGYKAYDQKVAFEMKMNGGDMSSALNSMDKDLGNIKLEEDAEVLQQVIVTGNKPMMQMGIDRKIFNVEKNITSAGGTAVDVMRNIPSLNVDIDGNVTLRNAAPQIFVDGRPTTLTLDQIPSDAIESVELITNPSAKYDASGGQSGILNVVLKKARKTGYNGGVRAGVDSRGRINLGGDINARQGKINVFANAMLNQRKSIGWGETSRINTLIEPNTSIFQDNDNTSTGMFGFGRVGFDFFINNRNTITVAQTFVRGNFKSDNRNYTFTDTLDGASGFETGYRNTLGEFNFKNNGTTVSYKKLFTKAGREWTADLNYNAQSNENMQDIRFRSFNDMSQQDPKFPERLQKIDGGGSNKFITAQTDYINPLSDNSKLEGGLRAQIRTFESRQLNYLNGTLLPNISNNFEYTDYVYAAYAVYSQKVKDKFNYQLGLRAESSSYSGEQIGKQTFKNEFPLSLFPSVFLTKNLKKQQDIQLNYTRKINRPNFFQLMPNTDFSDPLNLQTGNPDLKPEFTNSLEIGYQKTYGEKNNTFLATAFGKYTTNLIARYQNWQQLGSSTDSAFVATYINASAAYAAGLELIFRNTITSFWEVNLNTNIYYSKINGSNVVASLENERVSSFTKLNNTFKL